MCVCVTSLCGPWQMLSAPWVIPWLVDERQRNSSLGRFGAVLQRNKPLPWAKFALWQNSDPDSNFPSRSAPRFNAVSFCASLLARWFYLPYCRWCTTGEAPSACSQRTSKQSDVYNNPTFSEVVANDDEAAATPSDRRCAYITCCHLA